MILLNDYVGPVLGQQIKTKLELQIDSIVIHPGEIFIGYTLLVICCSNATIYFRYARAVTLLLIMMKKS